MLYSFPNTPENIDPPAIAAVILDDIPEEDKTKPATKKVRGIRGEVEQPVPIEKAEPQQSIVDDLPSANQEAPAAQVPAPEPVQQTPVQVPANDTGVVPDPTGMW